MDNKKHFFPMFGTNSNYICLEDILSVKFLDDCKTGRKISLDIKGATGTCIYEYSSHELAASAYLLLLKYMEQYSSSEFLEVSEHPCVANLNE